MAAFLRTRIVLTRFSSFQSFTSTRSAANWWRYGSKSKTEEDPEKLAAAIDPGLRLGDYPVLPWRSAQENAPYGWWDNQDRRNKETPLHEEDDALNVWMYDAVECNGKYTRGQALAQLMFMFSLLGGLYYISMLYDAPSRNPAVPRQFPYDNLYLERGGDPNKQPDEKDLSARVCETYGEITS